MAPKVACNFKMMAKAVLVRPNVAALCMWSSKRALSSLRGVTLALAKKNNYLSNDALLYVRKGPISSFNGPVLNYSRAFCIRASTESGPIGSTLMESMEKKIKEQLNAESVVVKDTSGDGRHVSINVISSSFEGQSAVNRQRMVYKAIWEELQDIVHAVDQMTTCTPSEASGK